mmetsp:Transcript_101333/g.180102  ORF Transcript_101333/g.180102 Transcript_101333/m.180102 type:complete len:674 (-) Transcript_101333:7-2028(-)
MLSTSAFSHGGHVPRLGCHGTFAKAISIAARPQHALDKQWTSLGRIGACAASTLALLGRRRMSQRPMMSLGPTPSWDNTGGPAVNQVQEVSTHVESGKLNKVVWMCWTGHNPIPSHLNLCLKTIQRNAGVPVILVTPNNLLQYVPDPHPAYQYLHLQHRADYLRCCLLHQYGGIYLDMDTICLRDLSGLFDLLDDYDAVGYDGSQWGELIGISDMGPFKPNTEITATWFNALHGKLQERFQVLQEQKTYGFYWQEILRDIFVPASLMHSKKVSTALQAHNPEQEALWSLESASSIIGPALENSHIFILNNSKYGSELSCHSEDVILGGPAVLSQVLRQALNSTEPGAVPAEPAASSAPEPSEPDTIATELKASTGCLPLTVGVGTCQVFTECKVSPEMMESLKQINAPNHFLINVLQQLDWALRAGYRVIDTAQRYGNEGGVGQALQNAMESGLVRREELFVTTKIDVKNMGYDPVLTSFEQSRANLKLDVVDLVILHFPPEQRLRRETWEAMERLKDEGKVRHIGVANHSEQHLVEILQYAKTPPAVNQIEVHPYHAQFDLVEFCLSKGISVMGYAPLGGRGAAGPDTGVTDALLADPTLAAVGRKYKKTSAQVALRWSLQRGVTPIPKTGLQSRLHENFAVLDFSLSPEDMRTINSLNRGQFVVCDLSKMP